MKAIARHWFVLAAVAVGVGCGGRGGDGSRWIPEGAGAVAIVPTVETLRGQLTALLAGVEGASGVLDLLEAHPIIRGGGTIEICEMPKS